MKWWLCAMNVSCRNLQCCRGFSFMTFVCTHMKAFTRNIAFFMMYTLWCMMYLIHTGIFLQVFLQVCSSTTHIEHLFIEHLIMQECLQTWVRDSLPIKSQEVWRSTFDDFKHKNPCNKNFELLLLLLIVTIVCFVCKWWDTYWLWFMPSVTLRSHL